MNPRTDILYPEVQQNHGVYIMSNMQTSALAEFVRSAEKTGAEYVAAEHNLLKPAK